MIKGITRLAAAAAVTTLYVKFAARAALLGVLALQLAACGGGGSSPTTQATATGTPPATPTPAATAPPSVSQATGRPTISGIPPSSVAAGTLYRFQPQATDASGAPLSFRTINQPRWLSLDASTGILSGNPQTADIGVYRDIVVSVSDGNLMTSLPAFTVEVVAAMARAYSATAVVIPATIEAERFDRGGEGIGYHDATAANAGGEFRPDEGVDIRSDPRAPGDNWIVNGFETGEWLAYTISVATAGDFELGLLASSAFNDSAYHVEIDGRDVTGQIAVPNTGNWDSFQWAGAPNVSLTVGIHVLKVVSDRQYFDLDSIVLALPPAPEPPPLTLSKLNFACSFDALPDCDLEEQSEVPGRASITKIGRDGGTALRLHTEPGDNNVSGSGAMERDDFWLSQYESDGYQDHEAWWAHSILFPDDFTVPTWQSYVVFDFHNSDPGPGQANFHVAFQPQTDINQPGLLSLIGYGGGNGGADGSPAGGRFAAVIGQVQKNVWYDFVYHVRWSAGSDGFFDAWVNGKRVLAHQGPTLYEGQGVYLKLANYHVPVCDPYPACIGKHKASSVIHDRIARGPTAQAVSGGPLEGYLDLINGVLTPRF